MVEMSFTRIPPPGKNKTSEYHYCKGWNFADDALGRYGAEACAGMLRRMTVDSSYNRGAADRWDGKPHKYGKAGA